MAQNQNGGGAMERYRHSASKAKPYTPPASKQSAGVNPNPNAIAPITNRGAEQNMIGEGASTQLIAAGATLQRTQTEFFTAVRVQVPRNKFDVISRVEDEMGLAPDGMMYSWSVKDKNDPTGRGTVEGPSVKMTNSIVAEYGNCIQRAKLNRETDTHWYIDGEFVDLERGVMTVRQFRQRKDQGAKSAKYDSERALDIAFQIGQSKAMRNSVLNGVPQSIIERATKKVKQALAQEAAHEAGGFDKAKAAMVNAFAKYKVTQDMIEKRLEKTMDQWTETDVADMRIVFKSILEGEAVVDDEFGDGLTREDAPSKQDITQGPPNTKQSDDELAIPDWNTLTGESVHASKEEPSMDPETGEVAPSGDDLPPE